MRIRQVVLVLAFTLAATAQDLPRVPAIVTPPSAEQVEMPPPQSETAPGELPVFTNVKTRADDVVPGDKGEIVLNGSGTWPYSVSGVAMRALTPAYPDITARLGAGNGVFRFLDHNDAPIMYVYGSGHVGIGTTPAELLHISRNQDAATAIRVNNDNAGTAAAAAMTSLRFSAGGVTTAQISSVGSGSTGYAGGPNALLLWNHRSAPTVIATANAERMRIHANGDVTIGSTSDYGRFGVMDDRDGGFGSTFFKQTAVEANGIQSDNNVIALTTQTVNPGIRNDGVATGTYSAAIRAGAGHSWRAIGVQSFAGVQDAHTGSLTEAIGVLANVGKGAGTVGTGFGIFVGQVDATTGYGIYQSGGDDLNFFGGRVGIGTAVPEQPLHVIGNGRVTGSFVVNGNVTVDGNIAAKFQDLAEWVPATEDLAPGTVVVLDPDVINQVMPSARAYDTTVAGVVSAQPGIVLGEAGPSKEQIATTGRVRVRVDATAGPIRIGDLLVSSGTRGTAMKSQPFEIGGGVTIHRPGTVIGKALEPLSGGVGEILVLLSLQ